MSELIILDIIDDKEISFDYNGEIYSKNEKDWCNFIKVIEFDKVTIATPISIETFILTRRVLDKLSEVDLEKIIIPDRLPCTIEFQEWVDLWLDDYMNAEPNEEEKEFIKKYSKEIEETIYRGTYLNKEEFSSFKNYYKEGISSWTIDHKIAEEFSTSYNPDDEYPIILELNGKYEAFKPTDYCSKYYYLLFQQEKEYILLDANCYVKECKSYNLPADIDNYLADESTNKIYQYSVDLQNNYTKW